MTKPSRDRSSRSVSIGHDAIGNVVQTGDKNVASLTRVTLAAPNSVAIDTELHAIRDLLVGLATDDRRKIENAFEDAREELAKSEPEKDEVGRALERALDYAKKSDQFADIVESLAPRVVKAVSWLGKNWRNLLSAVGLTI